MKLSIWVTLSVLAANAVAIGARKPMMRRMSSKVVSIDAIGVVFDHNQTISPVPAIGVSERFVDEDAISLANHEAASDETSINGDCNDPLMQPKQVVGEKTGLHSYEKPKCGFRTSSGEDGF